MPLILEGGCRVSEMREGVPNIEGTLRIWNQIGRATGAQAISLRTMEFAPGPSPEIRNGDCDEILYVLNSEQDFGRGHPARLSERSERTLFTDQKARIQINHRAYDIGPDTGIYVRPHERLAIDNPGPAPIILISSRCPEPDDAHASTASSTTPQSESSQPGPLVRLADRSTQPTADRWYRVMVDAEIGSTNATQFVGSIPPGRAPDHFHQYEEVLFILKGEGRMWAGATNTPIGVGSCIYLPKGQVHCVENKIGAMA